MQTTADADTCAALLSQLFPRACPQYLNDRVQAQLSLGISDLTAVIDMVTQQILDTDDAYPKRHPAASTVSGKRPRSPLSSSNRDDTKNINTPSNSSKIQRKDGKNDNDNDDDNLHRGRYEEVSGERLVKIKEPYFLQNLEVLQFLFDYLPLIDLRKYRMASRLLFVPTYLAIRRIIQESIDDPRRFPLPFKPLSKPRHYGQFFGTLATNISAKSSSINSANDVNSTDSATGINNGKSNDNRSGSSININSSKRIEYESPFDRALRYLRQISQVPHPLLVEELAYLRETYLHPQLPSAATASCDPTESTLECACCFGDAPFRGMLQCTEGHLFCRKCARRAFDYALGSRRPQLQCMAAAMHGGGMCAGNLPIHLLRSLINPVNMRAYERMVQEEEIRIALLELPQTNGDENGDDSDRDKELSEPQFISNNDGGKQQNARRVLKPQFVRCPFCDFGCLMETSAEQDRLFRCMNPGCMIESCRLCGQENHIPETCEEMKRKAQQDGLLDMRHRLEEAMTDALLRECPKCRRKFFKEDGCNKMTCSCGTKICYVCRTKIKGYDHFGNEKGKCPLWDDSFKRNHDDIQRSAEEALEAISASAALSSSATDSGAAMGLTPEEIAKRMAEDKAKLAQGIPSHNPNTARSQPQQQERPQLQQQRQNAEQAAPLPEKANQRRREEMRKREQASRRRHEEEQLPGEQLRVNLMISNSALEEARQARKLAANQQRQNALNLLGSATISDRNHVKLQTPVISECSADKIKRNFPETSLAPIGQNQANLRAPRNQESVDDGDIIYID